MTQPVPTAPYGEAVTETSTPVAVTTYRLVQELFETKREGDVAHVTFTDLRRLVTAGQRAMLEDLAARTEPEAAHMRLPKPWELMTQQGRTEPLSQQDRDLLWPNRPSNTTKRG